MQHEDASKTLSRGARARLFRTAGFAAAILIAGAALSVAWGPADASPNKVTASKPCGSCHPPSKPPKRK